MVELPEFPKGWEFEAYTSALFQCGGFYVERNIIEREKKEQILELDIVVTNYDEKPSRSLIVEVKSGDWGFSNIFKLKGWIDYLRYPDALLITNEPKENAKFYRDKARDIGVKLIQIDDLSRAPEFLEQLIPKNKLISEDCEVWRFSHWVERSLLSELKENKKKAYPDKVGFQKLDEYFFLLNSGIFFTRSIVERVHKLYDTFQKFPHISAKCGNELTGKSFDEEIDQLPREIYRATYYDCEYNAIQISTFIEHRARLALLKNAIDYLLGRNRQEDKGKKAFGRDYEEVLLHLLPLSFMDGLEELTKHKYFHKYPTFWQWFMWVFGGFVLRDYEEKEYQVLSQKSGIPIEEISNAFKSYEILFPQEGGWFRDLQNSNIRVLKLFSLPFSGIGANYRRLLYTSSKRFEDLKLSGLHTLTDLTKWNNLTIKVLGNKFVGSGIN